MSGLDLTEVELFNQRCTGLGDSLGATDDRYDLIDVVERDEQAQHDVQSVLRFLQAIFGPAPDDVESMGDVVLAQVVEGKRGWHAVD